MENLSVQKTSIMPCPASQYQILAYMRYLEAEWDNYLRALSDMTTEEIAKRWVHPWEGEYIFIMSIIAAKSAVHFSRISCCCSPSIFPVMITWLVICMHRVSYKCLGLAASYLQKLSTRSHTTLVMPMKLLSILRKALPLLMVLVYVTATLLGWSSNFSKYSFFQWCHTVKNPNTNTSLDADFGFLMHTCPEMTHHQAMEKPLRTTKRWSVHLTCLVYATTFFFHQQHL